MTALGSEREKHAKRYHSADGERLVFTSASILWLYSSGLSENRDFSAGSVSANSAPEQKKLNRTTFLEVFLSLLNNFPSVSAFLLH